MSDRIGASSGELVLHLRSPLLARDEVVDHSALERAGTVQRVERDQVVQALGLRLPKQLAHPRALELEDAVRLTVAEQLVGFLVVQRDGVDIEVDVVRALDFVERIANQRERAESEEVHLQEADALDLLHRPLRDDFVLRTLVERHELGERLRCDHDSRRVHRRMPCHPLEPLGDRDELSDPFVLLDHLLESRTLFEGLGEGHVECRRNRLRHLVGVGVRDVHHARDVADHGARLHGSERDDLRDVLAAVLARHVVDHFPAPPLAEVDVDVRQRDSFRVQEALEDEVVRDRIDVRDAQAVRDEASRSGATARADRNPLLARVADEVPDDQEVPGYFICLIISTS